MQIEQLSVSAVAGGALTLLGKIIFDWLKNRKTDNNKNNYSKLYNNIKWLKDIHNRYDENGSPMWFFPREMTHALEKIKQETAKTNVLLQQIADTLKNRG